MVWVRGAGFHRIQGGIKITGVSASSNVIRGCLIGTNLAGTAADGNTESGVLINWGADSTVIGGAASSYRNIISGNGDYGIELDGSVSSRRRYDDSGQLYRHGY